MTRLPVLPRAAARRDVDAALHHYLQEAGQDIALGFVDALEQAYRHLGDTPEGGSPRYAHELDLPGLRYWSLRRYPYLVFYVQRPDHVDVWRVLHAARDIPAGMQEGREEDPAPQS